MLTSLLLLFLAADVESFHGRQAWVLENDQIRMSLLKGGGHIAELRFKSGAQKRQINPMRIPHYQTIEPYQYDPAKHDALFGTDSHRWMHAGYMGHFVCFPFFGGPSSEAEVRNELGNHGEAPIVEWNLSGEPQKENGKTLFRYGADLPKTQYKIGRTISLHDKESVALVEEWVESLTDFDRPINWMQHVTFGPPFSEPGKMQMDLSGAKALVAGGGPTNSIQPNLEFTWPNAKDPAGNPADARMFQPKVGTGVYVAVQMDPSRKISYFTMFNPDYPVLVGYIYRTKDVPWLGDFQENRRATGKPWDGKTVTRGIEFGTTPFAEGLKKSVERGKLFETPTYRWIGGKQKQTMDYGMFLADIPTDFAGVADIVLTGTQLTIQERGKNRPITLRASGLEKLTQD